MSVGHPELVAICCNLSTDKSVHICWTKGQANVNDPHDLKDVGSTLRERDNL